MADGDPGPSIRGRARRQQVQEQVRSEKDCAEDVQDRTNLNHTPDTSNISETQRGNDPSSDRPRCDNRRGTSGAAMLAPESGESYIRSSAPVYLKSRP